LTADAPADPPWGVIGITCTFILGSDVRLLLPDLAKDTPDPLEISSTLDAERPAELSILSKFIKSSPATITSPLVKPFSIFKSRTIPAIESALFLNSLVTT
jgi:hypothetical protein